MTTLRHLLFLLALGTTLLASACVENDGTSDFHATDEIFDQVMEAGPVSPGELAVSRAHDGLWRFKAIGAKGDVILISNEYQANTSAFNGILSVEENGVQPERYVVVDNGDETFTFVLRAGNNQVIARGQTFRSHEAATAGAEAARELIAGIVQYKAAVTNGARFELWREPSDNLWYFVMRNDKSEVLLRSSSYQARSGAVNGIESVRTNGKLLSRYATVTRNDGLYVTLKAGNNHVIAESGPYANEAAAGAAIDESNALLISERVANPW